ncbi:variable large family protein (plasmid) [Borrelia coriaceae]|uniref:Variable large protein n=1 Tax=Borrelia coriaceae ATCC 43381 TaxID=1408429 RepID=W5SWK6_9SPIR|nr:variable large family protein [Borrelia coriaceae]AHH11267.1 Variable outer membrane protein [Borrelia coriaceae ATCC 43381]UPA17428.1 variable large family protein [Borrelia coriaceae]
MKIRIKRICATLFISLFLSCNNGIEELEKRNHFLSSLANLGNDFLDVFTSFGDMATDAFGIKAETKKSDIVNYFTAIATTMKTVKEKLNVIMAENGNYEKVKGRVNAFIQTIEKIEKGAIAAASGIKDANGNLGDIGKSSNSSKGGDAISVGSLVKRIKTIVEVVLKEGDGEKDITDPFAKDKQKIGKLFGDSTGNGAEEKPIAAGASMGAVSGAYMLKAIAKSSDKVVDVKVKSKYITHCDHR